MRIFLDTFNQLPWLHLKNNMMKSNVPADYKMRMYVPNNQKKGEYMHAPIVAIDTINMPSSIAQDNFIVTINKQYLTYQNLKNFNTETLSYQEINDQTAIKIVTYLLETLTPFFIIAASICFIVPTFLICILSAFVCGLVGVYINKKFDGKLDFQQLFRINIVACTIAVCVDNVLTVVRFPYNLYQFDWWLYIFPPIIVTFFAIKAHKSFITIKQKQEQESYDQPLY